MKKIILISFLIISQLIIYGQKPSIGLDVGYQAGKTQYFETGLNFTHIFKKLNMGSSISIGIEDNINSKDLGYKVNLVCFNRKKSSIPISFGVSAINYRINDNKINSFRPEIGLMGRVLHGGRGRSYVGVFYGYNITKTEYKSLINTHTFRLSINMNLKGFIELMGAAGYSIISVFHPNWS
jgi:hypothetical protein